VSWGGGVYVGPASTLVAVNLTRFVNNTARGGGGICNVGSAEITRGVILSNWASDDGWTENLGGGIYNGGTLVLRSSVVQSNHVQGDTRDGFGGGIHHVGSHLEILGTSVEFNGVTGITSSGGGLFLDPISGEVILTGSWIGSNDADDGGGIFLSDGGMEMEDCTVVSNTAAGFGGGMWLDHMMSDTVTITNSVVAANHAVAGGGMVVYNTGRTLIANSTISGNSADDDGGGIYESTPGDIEIASATVTDNTADVDGDGFGNGGGVALEDHAGFEMRNTILAANHDGSSFPSPSAPDCVGVIQSVGYNLVRNLGFPILACTIEGDSTGNILGMDPLLQVLTYNGGPTKTHALEADSPAVDAGDFNGCLDPNGVPLETDQRHGIRRDRCDMGAYEASALIDPLFWDGFESGDTSMWSGGVR